MYYFIYLLTLHDTDIPEAINLLGLKRDLRTNAQRHLGKAKNNDIPFVTDAIPRSLYKTKSLSESNARNPTRDKGEDKLQKLSMLLVLPMLNSFQMVEMHPSVDVNAIFWFEPMHVLHLGINNFSKNLLCTCLKAMWKLLLCLCQNKKYQKRTNKYVNVSYTKWVYVWEKLEKCFHDFSWT